MSHTTLPESPGVYVLKLSGVVVYVGQSRNVRKRVASHRVIEFDAVEVIACPAEQLRQMEKEKIAELRPTRNLVFSPWNSTTQPTCMITFRDPPGLQERLTAAELCTGLNRTELILACIRMAYATNGASLIPNPTTP